MKNSALKLGLAALVVLGGASAVVAHPLPGDSAGFHHGLVHPFTGLDHILAMVAIGLWAAQLGKRYIGWVPLTFVSVMMIGSWLGVASVRLPGVETGIVLSVIVLGLFIALAARLSLPLSMTVVGLFALFHGFAHGAEMPGSFSFLAYRLGFMLATAVLHAVGIAGGLLPQRIHQPRLVRLAGLAILAAGVYLWIA